MRNFCVGVIALYLVIALIVLGVFAGIGLHTIWPTEPGASSNGSVVIPIIIAALFGVLVLVVIILEMPDQKGKSR